MEIDDVPQDCQPIYYDHPEWLTRPDFWAMHVFGFCCLQYGCDMPENEVVDAFDMPAADIWTFGAREFTQVASPNGYPCYRLMLPLSGGGDIAFEHHEFPEDAHMQFRVYPPGATKSVQVGGYNGQSWDAKITWAELKIISESVKLATDDKLYHAATVPLLFPGILLNADDNIPELHEELRASLILLDVMKPDRIETIVDAMIAESRGVSRFIHEQPYVAIERESGLIQLLAQSPGKKR